MFSTSRLRISVFTLCICWFAGCGVLAAKILNSAPTEASSPAILKGIVTITTDKSGDWAFLTVQPATNNSSLTAAYVIQFGHKTSSPINFSGPATIDVKKFALEVRPDSGTGWMFKVDRYQGQLTSSINVPSGVVGIAEYNLHYISGNLDSHAKFVRAVGARLEERETTGLACETGGKGSTSCSVGLDGDTGSCSVTCASGYWACCNFGISCECDVQSLFD
jgi:hypothetical protein